MNLDFFFIIQSFVELLSIQPGGKKKKKVKYSARFDNVIAAFRTVPCASHDLLDFDLVVQMHLLGSKNLGDQLLQWADCVQAFHHPYHS